jgi:hypothetical protein
MGRASVHSAVAVVAALLVFCSSAALAQASSGDANATRAYLQADLVQTRAAAKAVPTALAAITALAGHLQQECPGVLGGEPKLAQGSAPSASTLAIDEEQSAAVIGVAEHTELARLHAFAHAVSGLSWPSRSLTRLARSSIAAEVAQAAVPPPALCSDLHYWVSSGYQTVSAATDSYVQLEAKLVSESNRGGEILKRLKPYEDTADKALARQILAIEKQAVQALVPKVLIALGKITEVLHGPAAVPAS